MNNRIAILAFLVWAGLMSIVIGTVVYTQPIWWGWVKTQTEPQQDPVDPNTVIGVPPQPPQTCYMQSSDPKTGDATFEIFSAREDGNCYYEDAPSVKAAREKEIQKQRNKL